MSREALEACLSIEPKINVNYDTRREKKQFQLEGCRCSSFQQNNDQRINVDNRISIRITALLCPRGEVNKVEWLAGGNIETCVPLLPAFVVSCVYVFGPTATEGGSLEGFPPFTGKVLESSRSLPEIAEYRTFVKLVGGTTLSLTWEKYTSKTHNTYSQISSSPTHFSLDQRQFDCQS